MAGDLKAITAAVLMAVVADMAGIEPRTTRTSFSHRWTRMNTDLNSTSAVRKFVCRCRNSGANSPHGKEFCQLSGLTPLRQRGERARAGSGCRAGHHSKSKRARARKHPASRHDLRDRVAPRAFTGGVHAAHAAPHPRAGGQAGDGGLRLGDGFLPDEARRRHRVAATPP